MIPGQQTFTVDTREFQLALKQYLLKTSRALGPALNARMFFVLLRAFLILPPRNPGGRRAQVSRYLTAPGRQRRIIGIGKAGSATALYAYQQASLRGYIIAKGKNKGKFKQYRSQRQLQARHLILQWRRALAGEKGLYGEAMLKKSAKFLRSQVGKVGYLKSMVVRGIKKLQGGFNQFGSKNYFKENQAAVTMAAQYGHALENVGLHKGTASVVQIATTGTWNPVVTVNMSARIKDTQNATVEAIVSPAFQKAFDDERVEMERHMAEGMQRIANEHNARRV